MRVLGLDVGEARIGLALSDGEGRMASPIGALQRSAIEADVRQVLEDAARHGAERLVVGVPISLSGERGPQERAVRGFVKALRAATALRVDTCDERLSTVEAERRLHEAGVKPSRDRGRLDAASAAIILQAYLDRINRPRP
ncbi:MAG: Holliday junction resolvase RuvX [Chloroflexota bacterium]|nr:Holliday junction resolvase RuvX [Chloroflexota bacterium]